MAEREDDYIRFIHKIASEAKKEKNEPPTP
jgi:hypothetical protein